jgi:hypothetical protein
MGAGPMTGGARGLCNPATAGTIRAFGAGYGRGMALRRGRRGGFGPGMGFGRGYGRGYDWYPPAAMPPYPLESAAEIDMLKAQADYMKSSLDAIKQRIDELERKPSDKS